MNNDYKSAKFIFLMNQYSVLLSLCLYLFYGLDSENVSHSEKNNVPHQTGSNGFWQHFFSCLTCRIISGIPFIKVGWLCVPRRFCSSRAKYSDWNLLLMKQFDTFWLLFSYLSSHKYFSFCRRRTSFTNSKKTFMGRF